MYPVVICDTPGERPLTFFLRDSIFPVIPRRPGAFVPTEIPGKISPIDFAADDHLDDSWLKREFLAELLLPKVEASLVASDGLIEKARELPGSPLVPESHENNDMRGNCRPEL